MVLTSRVLSDRDQRLCCGVELHWVSLHVQELDIIVVADNAAALSGFDVFLVDVARLVVKETMGVSAPGHTAHEHPSAAKASQ